MATERFLLQPKQDKQRTIP